MAEELHYYNTSDAISHIEDDVINRDALYKSLQSNIDNFNNNCLDVASMQIYPFTSGFGNAPYLILFDNRKYVLRRCRAAKSPVLTIINKKFDPVEMLQRQYQIMSLLHKYTPVPVPKVYYFCDDSSIVGTPFYVMEFKQGRVFRGTSHDLPTLSNNERGQYFQQMAKVLAKIHSVDIDKIPGFRHILENKRNQIYTNYNTYNVYNRWKNMVKFAAANNKNIAAFHAQIQQMCDGSKRLSLDCKYKGLVHGDFHYENIIWHPDKIEIIAVVDWEFTSIGDSLWDVAHIANMWELDLNKINDKDVNKDDFKFVKGFNGIHPHKLGIPTQAAFIVKYLYEMKVIGIKRNDYGNLHTINNVLDIIAVDFWRLVGIFTWINESNPNGRLSSAYPTVIIQYLADLGMYVLSRKSLRAKL